MRETVKVNIKFEEKIRLIRSIIKEAKQICTDQWSLTRSDPVAFEGIFEEVSLEGDEGGVDDAADGDVGEGGDEVVERHPKFAVVFEGQAQLVLFAVLRKNKFVYTK